MADDDKSTNDGASDGDKDSSDSESKLAELEAKVQEQESLIAQSNKQLDDAKTYIKGLVDKIQDAATKQPVAAPEPEAAFADKFEANPEEAIDEMFRKRVGPIYNAYLDNQAQMVRETFINRVPKQQWDKYGEEVDKFMHDMPADARANPKAYESAYNLVLSQHIDDIVEERVKSRVSGENPHTEHASPPGPRTPKARPLTEEEKRVARGFGMSEERYQKLRDEHVEAGGTWQRSR